MNKYLKKFYHLDILLFIVSFFFLNTAFARSDETSDIFKIKEECERIINRTGNSDNMISQDGKAYFGEGECVTNGAYAFRLKTIHFCNTCINCKFSLAKKLKEGQTYPIAYQKMKERGHILYPNALAFAMNDASLCDDEGVVSPETMANYQRDLEKQQQTLAKIEKLKTDIDNKVKARVELLLDEHAKEIDALAREHFGDMAAQDALNRQRWKDSSQQKLLPTSSPSNKSIFCCSVQ